MYCFNLTVDLSSKKKKEMKKNYGELEAFQKSQKIIKMVDSIFNNCSYIWISLRKILKDFSWKLKSIIVV